MIYLSDPLKLVIANNPDLDIARENTRIILSYLNDTDADDFDIMVDVGGEIFLAPFNGVSLLDGNVRVTPPNNANRATWCFTFQYGSSFATSNLQGTIMSIKNFQIEASDKAFLFESINEATRINVTDLYNSEVSVCWFGAVADGVTDNLIPFQRSIECFRKEEIEQSNTVYIPSMSNNGEQYIINSQLVINRTVKLTSNTVVNAALRFPNQGGLKIDEVGCVLSNLNILGPERIIYENYTNHGITVNRLIYMERVNISRFDGDGLHIISAGSNTNTSRFYNMRIEKNGRNGIYIRGADSNAMLFSGIDVRDNRACGIRDQSRLGNTYVGCHSSSNGNNIGNRSRVINEGQYYACILDNGYVPGNPPIPPINKQVEPGVDSDWEKYWLLVGPPSGPPPNIYATWSDSNWYVAAASYYNIGEQDSSIGGTDTSESVFIGCYSETDAKTPNINFINTELPIIINTASIVLGGVASQQYRAGLPVGGIIRNIGSIIETQGLRAKSSILEKNDVPTYSMLSPRKNVPLESRSGAFRIEVNIEGQDKVSRTRQLNIAYNAEFKSFETRLKSNGSAMMFLLKESLEEKPSIFGERKTSLMGDGNFYPAMNQPLFIKFLERNYSRLFGLTVKSPALEDDNLAPGFCRGDLFLYANITGNKYKNPLGWRCVANPNSSNPNGEWETLHYFEPAEPSANTATSPGITYSQTEVQSILDELRDLKTKLRTAGILKT